MAWKGIRAGDFYRTRAWKNLAHKVLREYHGECQRCRGRGVYTPAVLVHHELDRDDFPEYELSETYKDENGNERQNLIPLCFRCHEEIETERGNRGVPKAKPPLTIEWW